MDSQGRYQRHSLIDWFSQATVRDARICVVGAGAVGNEVLKCLALLGVGTIDVYDFDRIEVHNLTRSVLFRETDIGRNKAECAAARVRELDPNVAITAHTGNILRDLDLASFSKYSAVICCVDNFEARLRLNLICKLWQIDLINTGVDSRNAVVDTFPFSQHGAQPVACYECTLPPSVYQRLSQRYSCGGLKRAAFVEKRIPTTVITASLAGSLAASKALRLGPGSVRRSDRIFLDSISGISRPTELPVRGDCPVCSQYPAPVRRRPAGDLQAELARLRAENGASDVTLPESLILSFQCKKCDAGEGQDAPLFWRASDHDSGLANCRACGAEGAVEIQIVDRLPLETLVKSGVRTLPLPFALAASDAGTEVLVL
jgi:molybdopterin/thiamine biosynthesis adenylyltransferase